MNLILRGIVVTIICIVFSCSNDSGHEDCCRSASGIYKEGHAYAEGSYQNFEGCASFLKTRVADTVEGWKHDPLKKYLNLSSIKWHSDFCYLNSSITIQNFDLRTLDTIILRYSYLGLEPDFPTASYYILDDDALIETYHLVENAGDHWLLIESINADSTEITGRFNVSFVTNYEPYLTGERIRWDDANRPDTTRFINGEFRAKYEPY